MAISCTSSSDNFLKLVDSLAAQLIWCFHAATISPTEHLPQTGKLAANRKLYPAAKLTKIE